MLERSLRRTARTFETLQHASRVIADWSGYTTAGARTRPSVGKHRGNLRLSSLTRAESAGSLHLRLQMNLSVLMFSPQFRPLVGGAERQAEKLAIALAEADCKVTILTPRLDPTHPIRR